MLDEVDACQAAHKLNLAGIKGAIARARRVCRGGVAHRSRSMSRPPRLRRCQTCVHERTDESSAHARSRAGRAPGRVAAEAIGGRYVILPAARHRENELKPLSHDRLTRRESARQARRSRWRGSAPRQRVAWLRCAPRAPFFVSRAQPRCQWSRHAAGRRGREAVVVRWHSARVAALALPGC